MKKLLFIFVALLALVATSGCGTRQNTVRFNGEGNPIKEDSTEASENTAKDGEADGTVTATTTKVPTGKLSVTSFDGAYLKTNFSYNVVKGTVHSDTKKITINDYKLSKYIGGQTQWDYIASTRFGTLKSGLNTYVVKTFDADGEETDSLIFSINYEAPAVPTTLPNVGSSLWLTLLTTLMISGIYTVFRKYRCL